MPSDPEICFTFHETILTICGQMIFSPSTDTLHFSLVVLPHSNMLALAAIIDPLRAVNRAAGEQRFQWSIHTPDGSPVLLTSGLELAAEPPPKSAAGRVLAVLAGFNLQVHASRPLLRDIRRLAGSAIAVSGVDAGGLILARAGILDGYRATTHWEDLEEMTARFPAVNVVRDRFVVDRRCFTAGGAAPCLDMMLYLIRQRCGRDIAERVAGAFTYDAIHPASDPQQPVSVAQLQRHHPRLARAIDLMESNLEECLPVVKIASQVGLSGRRLEMLFRQVLDQGPAGYYRHLRLAEAHRMTVDTALPLQDIAVRCGFNSQSAFTRAFSAAYGMPPSKLRQSRPGFQVGLAL